MTDHEATIIIRNAEKATRMSSFLGTRIGTAVSLLFTPLMLLQEVGVGMGVLTAGMAWGFTYLVWITEKDFAQGLTERHAELIWKQIRGGQTLGIDKSSPMRSIVEQIAQVYKGDPEGELLPLSQAVRLSGAWQQQQEHLVITEHRLNQMKDLRATLLEKQRLLHDLGDENAVAGKTLARLDGDISSHERNSETLRASCDRLEALVVAVDTAARRRQLHREIGELAAQFPEGEPAAEPSFGIEEEHLDIERQISREIETFLQLERDTDTHLRDL